MVDILPTHSCFDDALANLIYLMKREGIAPIRTGRLLIVHGIIAPYGEDIAHAWLERDGKTVIFSGVIEGQRAMIEAELQSYYADSHVKESTKYTLFEAYAAELKSGHFGPWVEKYRQLCPDVQKEVANGRDGTTA